MDKEVYEEMNKEVVDKEMVDKEVVDKVVVDKEVVDSLLRPIVGPGQLGQTNLTPSILGSHRRHRAAPVAENLKSHKRKKHKDADDQLGTALISIISEVYCDGSEFKWSRSPTQMSS